jgi:hypothetical protein
MRYLAIMSNSMKFYVPEKLDGKYLFGYKNHEKNCENSSSSTSITIVTESDDIQLKPTNLEFIGALLSEREFKSCPKIAGFTLITDEKKKVYKVLLNGHQLPASYSTYIFYYNKEKFQRTYDEFHQQNLSDSHFALSIAKCLKVAQEQEVGELAVDKFSRLSHTFLTNFAGKASSVLKISSKIFKNTAINRHCSNWKRCLSEDHSRNGFVVLDVMLGILFFLLMNHIQDSGHYFMNLTEIIVRKLRGLLEMLDGSPVGLKLNVQLNNFLLSCFMYHVDLWFNFIVIVEPAIHYLFVPITVFGFFGLSFQCALICDIITLITLHAHCFYIYAAMLYKLEVSSIRALLRVVLGRRLNVLKSEILCLFQAFSNLSSSRSKRIRAVHEPSTLPRHTLLHDASLHLPNCPHLLPGVCLGKLSH